MVCSLGGERQAVPTPAGFALRAVDVIERPVPDEHAVSRLGHADGGHRRLERAPVRLGPADLAGIDGPVDEVEHAVAAEDLLVPAARPEGVRQLKDQLLR